MCEIRKYEFGKFQIIQNSQQLELKECNCPQIHHVTYYIDVIKENNSHIQSLKLNCVRHAVALRDWRGHSTLAIVGHENDHNSNTHGSTTAN